MQAAEQCCSDALKAAQASQAASSATGDNDAEGSQVTSILLVLCHVAENSIEEASQAFDLLKQNLDGMSEEYATQFCLV